MHLDDQIADLLIDRSTYTDQTHDVPYIFSLQPNGQRLYYFGARHSHDPNPQVAQRQRGEGGVVARLSQQDPIPVSCPEPSWQEHIDYLQEFFCT